ncbi:MAG: helix-turn-helix domain-containing protein, partial [Microbacterium sp.]
ELVEAEPGTASVTEVAARWGFVHLGRFAAAYHREFHERPSDTLRSARVHLGANTENHARSTWGRLSA